VPTEVLVRPAAVTPTLEARAVILIRLMIGGIFLSEGAQIFLFPADLGVGKFTKLGIPDPQLFAQLTGYVEVMFGALVLVGIFTRVACVPLLIVIAFAMYSTSLPILEQKGIWTFLHESRTNICMLLGLLYLIIAGAGTYSYDGGHGVKEPR
jgi:putative oxidoreductase